MSFNTPNIHFEFNKNACELKIPIKKKGQGQNVANCDLFIYECCLFFVSDIDTIQFECPREFDLTDMKNIPINFNTEQWEYTCTLPCYPDEVKSNNKKVDLRLCQLTRITDSCVLSVDGKICEIQADYPYGFSGRYRGKPKYNEDDLSRYCRITHPNLVSPFKRAIQREIDETKDFCRDDYKFNCVELQIPEGHENPIEYTISYEDVKLTQEEECILEKIKSKHTHIDDDTDLTNIDCGLASILLAICYDIRFTSNEPTCVSPWTRTVLSATLCYFEKLETMTFVVESFLRRSLIYPLYHNYDLSVLCVQDAMNAMQKGKSWILKQLLVTYKCFSQADFNHKSLNKYFIKHYIWYVDTVMDDDHLQILGKDLRIGLLCTAKKDLRLGLVEIETEMINELIHEQLINSGEESCSDSES